jgi:hypothetical protein
LIKQTSRYVPLCSGAINGTEKQCDEITKTIGAERLIELVSNPAITWFYAPEITLGS